MDLARFLRPWILFAGFVLIVAVLYWAQAVLVPIAAAVLLTFLLAPAVALVERWVHRVIAVSAVALLTFAIVGTGTWAVARELAQFADALPGYRVNIREKIADIRSAGRGGSVEKIQETLDEINKELADDEPAGVQGQPVVVESEQVSSLWGFPLWMSPLIEPLSTAGVVIVMVLFMLLEREDLRDRLVGVVGHGNVTSTTRAFGEAGSRVSRYLLMQSIVNLIYGIGVGVGLYLIGVPYFLLWAFLGAILRFIPYLGPVIAAGAPILVSLAALPGWTQPLEVMALFLVLELFTNLVLETYLYAGAAGVSQAALIIAIAFWTWLWGPMGLLLATPMTVVLVVLGKHVPGLEFVATLLGDAPALEPAVRYYQRLLARDESEAADIIEAHINGADQASPFDALLLPALNYAERDRMLGRLSADEETAVGELTRDLIADTAALIQATPRSKPDDVTPTLAGPLTPTLSGPGTARVLAYANSEADLLALRMLEHVLREVPVSLDVSSGHLLASDVVRAVQEHQYRIVCIADLPPSPPSKTRYLIRKLRAANRDLKIVVGRWAPPELLDDDIEPLRSAGADYIGTTLQETREHLRQLTQISGLLSPPNAA